MSSSALCSLLKIWNLNKFSGVIGVFNCQGAGQWVWPVKDIACVPTSINITGHLSPSDVEFIEEIAGHNWNGESAVYAYSSCKLCWLPVFSSIPISSVITLRVYPQLLISPLFGLPGSLSRLQKHQNLEVSLSTMTCEIYTISPVKVRLLSFHALPILAEI